jgi:sentrin-specific protease 1
VVDKRLFRVKPSPYRIPQYPEALVLHLYPIFVEGQDDEEFDIGSELHISSMDRRDILDWSYYLNDWLGNQQASSESLVQDLTREERQAVSTLLSRQLPLADEVLIDKFNIQVTRKTLSCLRKLEWLSDEVVNFYFSLIFEKFKGNHIFCWNSFFYTKLVSERTGYNYSGVRNWATKKAVDLFDLDKVETILIPLHISDQAHWALGVVNMKDRTTMYLDSLGGDNYEFHSIIVQYLSDEYAHKHQGDELPERKSWTHHQPPEKLPQQTNGSDCGVYICMFALAIARSHQPNFIGINPDSVEVMRQRMVLEIVRGEIS